MSTPSRPQLQRTPTWPPSTLRLATVAPVVFESEAGSLSAATTAKSADTQYFDDDLETHPGDHFLSPMYEYEDWASDSDDDEEDFEWDAGITDFALIDSDRRRAQETHRELDRRWTGFLSDQQLALQRAAARARADVTPDTTRPPLPFEDVPGLTPDSSPSLRDDLEPEDHPTTRFSAPSYLTITVTPPSPGERSISEDDDLPLSINAARGKQKVLAPSLPRRPGMRNGRTLSGKLHSWKRPNWKIHSVGEDPDGERQAEMGELEE